MLAVASRKPALPPTPITIRSNARLAALDVLRISVVVLEKRRKIKNTPADPRSTMEPIAMATINSTIVIPAADRRSFVFAGFMDEAEV